MYIQYFLKIVLKLQQKLAMWLDVKLHYPAAACKIAQILSEANNNNNNNNNMRIIDIGCGSGNLAVQIKKKFQAAQIVLTDIEQNTKLEHPFLISNADDLPFANNTFAVGTIFYALHHTINPEIAIKEACRVATIVVIQEDVYKNRLQKFFYTLHLRSYMINFKASEGLKPFTDSEWRNIFIENDIVLLESTQVCKFLGYPVGRVEYIVKSAH